MKDHRDNSLDSSNLQHDIPTTLKTTTPIIFGHHVPLKDLTENKISFINSLTNNCAQRLQLVVEPVFSKDSNNPCSYLIGILIMRNHGNNNIDVFDFFKHPIEELVNLLKNELENFDLSFSESPKLFMNSYSY